jgi:hypothetical protein
VELQHRAGTPEEPVSTWFSDSGSSRSPSPVEPTRSLNTTVTVLRACVPPGTSGAPQARQNRARSGFSSWHRWQVAMAGV